MAKVGTNGIEIDYAEQGPRHGSPFVLIRGLGTQRISWPGRLLDGLADAGHRVVTFDNRDAGLSTKFDAYGPVDLRKVMARAARGQELSPPYTLSDMAADLVGLLDALSIDSAHVAGISMGGMIAQVLAAQHGPRLRSVASIMSSSGAPGLPGPTPEAAAALMSTPKDPESRDSVIENALAVQRVIGSPGYPTAEATLRERAGRAYDRCYCPDGVGRQMLAVLACGSRVPLLQSITVPALVLHGADDPLVPLAAGEDTARHIPGAELRVVPGMGHDVAEGLVPLLLEALLSHAAKAESP